MSETQNNQSGLAASRRLLRRCVVGLTAAVYRLVAPLATFPRRWLWTAAVYANARQAGTGLYVYGPVRFLGTQNVTLGERGNLYDNVLFETEPGGAIEIGSDFTLNRGVLIAAHDRITIGDHALIGEYVSIRDNDHAFADPGCPIHHQGYDVAPVQIGNDVWIGRGAVVLKGVTIGDGTIVAANAVVTKDIPPMEIWAGIPARFLRSRNRTDSPS